MVHMSYVPPPAVGPESTRTYRSVALAGNCFSPKSRVPEIQRRGSTLGLRTWNVLQVWRTKRRRGERGERGAEMVEFAFVVVLLIALLYGIVSYGLILSAQSTVTQAAADGARAGIVAASTSLGPQGTAEGQAANDLSWMDKGQCYQPHAQPSVIG